MTLSCLLLGSIISITIIMCLDVITIWLLLVLVSISSAAASVPIAKLPGFEGDLPFRLQTGYVGVGEEEEVQLFYYLVESEECQGPLVLWISGGPGCSSASAFFYQNGPLTFPIQRYNGSLPKLHLNPNAWTKGLSMLYLDGPVGTGFSYATSPASYHTGDYKFVANVYEFIHKWLMDHPTFSTKPLYLSGDGYSGNIVPMVIQEILNGNEVGSKPQINIKGYVLGNPGTDVFIDFNSRVPLAHRLGLVPDELYQSAKRNCNGDYVSPNPTQECAADMGAIKELLSNINNANTLDPTCRHLAVDTTNLHSAQQHLKDKSRWFFKNNAPDLQCRKFNHMLCYIWANSEAVQEALHVRKGTVQNWQFCKDAINETYYTHDVPSVVDYHRNFTNTSLRALIYSGDHDTGIPYIGTQEWIWSLNMTVIERWRAWSVDNETAGFTRKFLNKDFSLTYATVKGAGHFAAEYKGKECSAMVHRWMAHHPI